MGNLITNNCTGINCVITFCDSFESMEALISFKNQDEDVSDYEDEKIFYYLDQEDIESLNRAIAVKASQWECTSEWFIDLTEGYELCG